MWELNTLHRTWYCKPPRITLLLQCNHILHLLSGLIEHSPNVLSVFLVSLKNIHNLWVLPIGALSTSIGSAASSECVLVVSGGLEEGLGCGLSALIRAMSIFGKYTRYVRGARHSMGAGGCPSPVVSRC
ncbi:hypothetical protein DY000_02060039 [Brassica cretica]|uniref:Uncharacterized protein n=1 Tax=Brassica cretica TaxID=69181 RepID=A0ABQ7AXJ6_BRACR|nr:hypothetical protein DY000_02060039 [Brassica cretica]